MKKNSTGISKLLRALSILFPGNKIAKVDMIGNALQKENHELVAGQANEVGAVYKFPVVTPGLEALITITGLKKEELQINNQLSEEETNDSGTQTLVKPVSVKQDEESWVSFKIDFKNTDIVPEVQKKSFRISLNNIFYSLF